MAEPKPTEWPFQWQGIFTELSDRHMPANALSDCQDMYYTGKSILRGRGGFHRVFEGSDNKVTILHYWEKDGKLYHADNAGNLYKEGTAISGVTNNVTDMCSFMKSDGWETVLIVSENGNLFEYDGTNYTEITKKAADITAASFYGSGSDDCTSGGTYTGDGVKTFVVEIDDSSVDPNTFRWSNDGGESWESIGVAITGSAQTLEDGIEVTFGSTTGHDGGDRWTFDAIPYPDVPSVSRVMSRWGRVFGFEGHWIYWSAPFDPTNWGGYAGEGDYLGIYPGEYGEIVDWVAVRRTLYIFKERALFAVTGNKTSNFTVELVTEFDSPIEHTVANCKKGIAYATKNGVYPLGNRASEAIDWTRRVEVDISDSLTDSAQAVYSDRLCCYLIMDGTSTVWVSNHHNRPDVWTQFNLSFNGTCGTQGGGDLYLGSDSGNVYKYFPTGTDDIDVVGDSSGTEVSPYFITSEWDLGEKLYTKDVSTIEGKFNASANGTAKIGIYKNGAGATDQIKELSAGDRPIIRYESNVETIQIKVSYSDLTGPVRFQGMKMRVKPQAEII